MTRTMNPEARTETPTVDQSTQTAIPDAENVADHATDATGDDQGPQNHPHDQGQEAEIGIVIGTESTDVEDHAKTKVQDEDHATKMTKKMTNGSQNVAL